MTPYQKSLVTKTGMLLLMGKFEYSAFTPDQKIEMLAEFNRFYPLPNVKDLSTATGRALECLDDAINSTGPFR